MGRSYFSLFLILLSLVAAPSWSQDQVLPDQAGVSPVEVRAQLSPIIERMESARDFMVDQYGSSQAPETLRSVMSGEEGGHPDAWGQWLYLSWSYIRNDFYNHHINTLRQSMSLARTLGSLGQDDVAYLEQGVETWFQQEQQIQDAFRRLVDNYAMRAENLGEIARKTDELYEAGQFDAERRQGREEEIEQLLNQREALAEQRTQIEQNQETISAEIDAFRMGPVFASLNSSERVRSENDVAASIADVSEDESILDQIEQDPALAVEDSIMDQIESGQNGAEELISALGEDEAPLNELVETELEDWERDAAAAMDATLSDAEDEDSFREEFNRSRDFVDNQDSLRNPDQIAQNDLRELQNQFVERRQMDEARQREERLADLDQQSLEAMRADALESLRRYEDAVDARAAAEGREWTPEESAEWSRRDGRYVDLMQPTALENEEIAKQQEVNDRVNRHLQEYSDRMGGTSPAEVAARAQTAAMFDAATAEWRDFTGTGTAISMVQEDIVAQRERGIAANNDVMAATAFLQNPNLTTEERHAAEQFLERAVTARGAAAEAIVVDTGVVLAGAAFDAGSFGAGGTVSRGVSRIFGRAGARAGSSGAAAGREAAEQLGQQGSRQGAAVVAAEEAVANQAGQRASQVSQQATRQAPTPNVGQPTPTQIRQAEDALTSLQQIADEPMELATRVGQPSPAEIQAAEDALTSLRQIADEPMELATRVGQPSPAEVRAAEDALASLDQIANYPLGSADDAARAALRTQNQMAERELAQRLAREGDEADLLLEQARRTGRELTPGEAANAQSQLAARNYNRQLNEMLEEARRVGIPEEELQRAVEPAHNSISSRLGNSEAARNVNELLARSRGYQIVPAEQAESILTTITNIETGAAGRAEAELIRRNIQAAESQGRNFFDDVAKQGTITSDGYQPLADDIDLEALWRFAQQNGLID